MVLKITKYDERISAGLKEILENHGTMTPAAARALEKKIRALRQRSNRGPVYSIDDVGKIIESTGLDVSVWMEKTLGANTVSDDEETSEGNGSRRKTMHKSHNQSFSTHTGQSGRKKRTANDTLKLLGETVDELTKPIPYTWTTDHGTRLHRNAPCLLDQLRDSIEECEKRPGSGRSRKGRHPDLLDFKALDLEQDVKAAVNAYYRKYGLQDSEPTDVKSRLRSWAADAGRRGGKAAEETYAALRGYRNAIVELFNPHAMEIKAPCPKCNMRYIEKTADGEKIRINALKANSGSVICTACGYRWDSSRFLELGKAVLSAMAE